MATELLTDDQKRLIQSVEEDGEVRKYFEDMHPAVGNFRLFLSAPETLRLVLTSIAIPVVVYLGGLAYGETFGWKADQAASLETRSREEVDEVSKLLPIGIQTDDGRRVVTAILNVRARDDADDSVIKRALAALSDKKKSEYPAAPPSSSNAPPPQATATITPTQAAHNALLNNSYTAPGIVYLQIYSEQQRADAEKVVTALGDQSVPVAGIENVLKTHPDLDVRFAQHNEIGVRFYHSSDRTAADYAAAQVASTLGKPVVTQDLSSRPVAAKVKPGLVEIWFPLPAAY